MSYLPLRLPPGVFRPGTKYDAKGRWYDANLVRWHENAMQPVGGWQALEVTTPSVEQVDLGGRACGMISWRANDGTAQLAAGTPAELYEFSGGVLSNITPTGFVAGGADASLDTAIYGAGAYGAGLYGTGDPAQGALTEAQNWALDTFGEDLVGCAYSDGKIYYWDKSAGGLAVVLSGAPVDCVGVVVTPERFVVTIGADGDQRKVAWCDQEAPTVWTPDINNQAGDFTLPGVGQLMAGRRSRTETLFWTDADLFAMRYIGGDLVYTFRQEGSACGIISRRGMGMLEGKAVWMGLTSFYVYDGYTRPLPCEVGDYVFSDINRTQASKVWADVRGGFSEVTWYYPSAGSSECDRYVTYNYQVGYWTVGQLQRTAGADSGALPYPVLSDASGLLYQHEAGLNHLDTDGNELSVYAESGPVEIGDGDAVLHVMQLVPDERTLGDVSLSLIVALYPTAAEQTFGPYTMANPASVRVTGRQVRVRADQVRPGWRLGTPRLEIRPGGMR